MKKFISLVIVALCFCACDDDEVKEYQTQCGSKESCKKECEEGNGAACLSFAWWYDLSVEQKITYAQKSCDLHYAEGCFELAELYGEEYGIDFAKEHYQKALKMLQKSCEQNHNGRDCISLGYLYYKGKGVTQDFDKALSYHKKACELKTDECGWIGYFLYLDDKKYNEAKYFFEKACDKNDSWGCKSLGDLYYKGKDVTQDFDKALNYYEKACELKTDGCHSVGGWYLDDKKYNEAKYFFEKACDKNDSGSCKLLGDLYYKGKGVTKDFDKALSYYEKACDHDGYYCRFLGNLYYEGKGVTQDFEKALSYYKKACELDAYECHLAGILYSNDKKYNEAKYFFEKACDKDADGSCKLLGDLYYKMQDFDKAFNYHKKACELYASGCRSLGDLYFKDKKYNEAKYFFEKACELSAYECRSLGDLYLKDKKYNEAISFYEKGCDKNDSGGCKSLGDLYYKGKGVTQDFDKALSYHKKACELAYLYCGGDLYLKDKKYNEAKYFYEKGCKSDCFNEGLEKGKEKDYIKARLYYEIACDKGNAAGCNNLGVLYGSGKGVAKNTAKAKTFYEKSCGMNEALACQNVGYHYYNARQFAKAKAMFEKGCGANLADSCSFLGILYEFGEGVRQDLSTAKSYYGKGCDGGSQRGCDGYKKLNQRGVR